jgi:hypothetical protein
MFLVVGLVIAGAVGIAAAFYFTLRSGRGGDRRLRSIGAGRAGTGRRPGSRSVGTARPDRTNDARRAANGSRPVNTVHGANASSRNYQAEASTGPNPALDFGAPVLVGGRRGGQGTSAGDPQATDPRLTAAVPDESRLGESRMGESSPGSRSAARLTREAHAAGDADRTARPRRRVGFRKGADVDEELWPAESFGGVSDEQFWDDLASDKPLTTTARTAQQDPGTRNRPFEAVPPLAGVSSAGARSAGVPSAGRPPVAGPPAATQPVQSMPAQVSGATQPVRTAAGTSQLMSAPSRPVKGSQPVSAAAQPAETRGRRRASRSDDEDPLTSAAFSLRSSGPVDGRSSRRSQDTTREQYDAAVMQETQTFTAAETEAASSGYPGGVPPFRQSGSPADRSLSSYSGTSYGDPSSITQAMNTPPHGENYGYGSGGSPAQPAQPDDPRRHNGTRSHARHGGNDEASRAARQAYPQDGYQGTGSYPAGDYQGTGSYPAGGYPTGGYSTAGYPDAGHQGNGRQASSYPGGAQQTSGYPGSAYPGSAYPGSAHQGNTNGHRAPYDPKDAYRRLTHRD